MTLLSCLTDGNSSLIVDTSVAINLNATQFSEQIIKAFDIPFLMTDIAYGELSSGYNDVNLINDLAGKDLLKIVPLCSAGEEVFLSLVSGQASKTLDDGEAATIAFSHITNSMVAIDEKKATSLCKEDYPSLDVVSMIDILSHPNVLDSLGEKNLSEAVYNALRTARMRVPLDQVEWVLKVVGSDKASECPSLPRKAKQNLEKIFA